METLHIQGDRMAWWREARFGMFIHWGLYAIPAGVWEGRCIPGIGEWIMYNARIPVKEYEKLAKRFNPFKFDAKEWVRIAKMAGMKYIVITAKHHDGFCMFDTDLTDYNIVKATPFGRDPLKELSEACREEGLRLGFYYSQTLDWHHPDGMGNFWDYDLSKQEFTRYLREYVKPQLEELLRNYGPIAILWFDITTPTPELARELKDFVRRLSPETIISGRIGGGLRTPSTPFKGLGDYITMGDNQIPDRRIDDDWEVPMTLNDTWGYKSYDHNWKTPGRIVQMLVDIVSKGGNLLLNVGPTAEGEIPKPSVDVLLEVGRWLKNNGESIYGAGAAPLDVPIDGPYRCTYKPGMVYLHVFGWPWDGRLRVFGAKGRIEPRSASLLREPSTTLPWEWEGEGDLVIRVPEKALDSIDTVIILKEGMPKKGLA
ncbi:alpha-L-fucosidase [Candidatus Bathyarchaeota archaeon]|nr:alpha-L-fucosidase [Candidatus Bathyarchaeota archaeon]